MSLQYPAALLPGQTYMLMTVKQQLIFRVQIPVNSWEGSRILKWNLSCVTMSNVTSNSLFSYLPLRDMDWCGITRLQGFKYLHNYFIVTYRHFEFLCQRSLIPRPLLFTVLQFKAEEQKKTGGLWEQEHLTFFFFCWNQRSKKTGQPRNTALLC